MRASVVEPPTSPDFAMVGAVVGGILLLLLFWRTMSSKPDYGRVVSILKDEQGIEAEDAGETNHSHMFNISISAMTQHFDLNGFTDKMRRLGCSVLSTADTNNPSFRTLTVQVPKRGKGMGLSGVLLVGCLLGTGLAGYFYQDVYKLFSLFETILGNV